MPFLSGMNWNLPSIANQGSVLPCGGEGATSHSKENCEGDNITRFSNFLHLLSSAPTRANNKTFLM
jgi:hypothetical protein